MVQTPCETSTDEGNLFPTTIEFWAGLVEESPSKMKKKREVHICPRCHYPLLPVHSVRGTKRSIIALTCPEPYCDHIEFATVPGTELRPATSEPDPQRQVS